MLSKPASQTSPNKSRQSANTKPASPVHASSSIENVLHLQRTVGNHATLQIMHRTKPPDVQRSLNYDQGDGLYTYTPDQGGNNPHANQKFIEAVLGGQTYYRNIRTRTYYTYNGQNDTLTQANVPNNPQATNRNQQIEIVEPGFIIGSFQPTFPPAQLGYVVNIPATLPKQGGQYQAADLANIANRYLEGFPGANPNAQMNTARSQYGMVIGLNVYDAQNTNVRALIRQSVANFSGAWNNNNFPVAVFGFVWRNPLVDQGQAIGQDTIPYGEARETILKHPFTQHLVTEMRSVAGCGDVYLHTADADVESLQVKGGGTSPTNNTLGSGAQTPLYQAVTAQLGGNRPDIISGGYEFRMPNGQNAPNNSNVGDLLLTFASRLDLTIRDVMNGLSPKMIYFPEPNTFYKVEQGFSTLEGSFGHGKNEGQQMMDSLTGMRHDPQLQFVSGLSLETEARQSMRDNFHSVQGGNQMVGNTQLNATHIKKLFELAQSHGRMQTWVERVQLYGTQYGQNVNGQKLQELYRAAFPHEITNGDPDAILNLSLPQIQQSILNWFNQDKTALPQIDIEGRGMHRRICNLASASANAALTFLKAFINAWRAGTL